MTSISSISALLGFAQKSGKLFIGESAVEAALKKKKARLILLAEDLPPNRIVRWELRINSAGLKKVAIGTKQELGQVLGLAELGVIAVSDRQMAAAILNRLNSAH